MALAFGALSGLTLFLGINLTTLLTDMCSGNIKSNVSQVKELASDFLAFENNIANWTSMYMCTPICPCETSVSPSRWDEKKLNKYNRTNKVTNANYTDPTSGRKYVGF